MFLVAPVAASTLPQLIHRGWRRAVNQQSPDVEVFKNTPNQPKTTGDRSEMLGEPQGGCDGARGSLQGEAAISWGFGICPGTGATDEVTGASHPVPPTRGGAGPGGIFPLSPPKISRVWGARGSSDPKRAKLRPLSELCLAYSRVPNLPFPNSCGNQGEVRDGNIPVSQR